MKKVIKVIKGLRAKSSRLVRAVKGVEPGRKGECTPEKCSTLEGEIGAACCYIDYTCFCVSRDRCLTYRLRPLNCRVFPSCREDLKLVRKCGYYWTNGKEQIAEDTTKDENRY